MDTQEIIDYYADLLPKEYVGQPNAYAQVQTLVAPILMPQGGDVLVDNEGQPIYDNEGQPITSNQIEPILPLALENAFNLETAVGVQLDQLGAYIGPSRVGFTFSGPITLTDTQYRQFLNWCILRNHLTGGVYAIQNFIVENFGGVIQVFNYPGQMRMGYTYLAAVGAQPVVEFFIKAGLLPVPLAIGAGSMIYPQSSNIFGFSLYEGPNYSFQVGCSLYDSPTTGIVLNYSNSLPAVLQ